MCKKWYFIFYFGSLLSFITMSCSHENKEVVNVDFSDTVNVPTSEVARDSIMPIYIAIASMTSPSETFKYYHSLVDYISGKLGHPIYIKEKKTYEEVNELVATGAVAFAFICSGAYIEAKKKKSIKLLVAPLINHQTYYQSYIIVNKKSEINTIDDLKNRRFAFTDPISNTGCLYPKKLLKDKLTSADKYFSKIIYTYGHDVSIQMVNNGAVDGAAIHSLIFQYLENNSPELLKNVKVIKKSQLFGMPPVVTSAHLNESKFNQLRNVFLNINKDSAGREILKTLGIEKFVVVNDSIYNNVRKLKN